MRTLKKIKQILPLIGLMAMFAGLFVAISGNSQMHGIITISLFIGGFAIVATTAPGVGE